MATAASPHRFDAEVYGRIVASGALDDQRVELIDGQIVDMSPRSVQHDSAIEWLTRLLHGGEAFVRVQLSLHVASDSVLEPDIALTETAADWEHHPTTALLVVEVAISSLALDRGRKAELYAAAGVPAYWVVDVADGSVAVHREPMPSGGYRDVRLHRGDDELPIPAAGVAPFTVAQLCGSPGMSPVPAPSLRHGHDDPHRGCGRHHAPVRPALARGSARPDARSRLTQGGQGAGRCRSRCPSISTTPSAT